MRSRGRIKLIKHARISFRVSCVAVALLATCAALAQDRPSVTAVAPTSAPTIAFAPVIASVGSPPSGSAATTRMLHRWHYATSLPQDDQSLNQLLAQRPDLQTHSHMTYYSSPVLIGQRARLQPPGSEFNH
ncbi:hypothetical protein AWB71_05351 [Caballeronia peredens]|nr:hypothetical protein AWB71_05351 [Caballeronia peredens]